MAGKVNNKRNLIKEIPTLFPSGFLVGITNDNIIKIEFIDNQIENDKEFAKIVGSFAMNNDRANDLIKTLQKAVEKTKNDVTSIKKTSKS